MSVAGISSTRLKTAYCENVLSSNICFYRVIKPIKHGISIEALFHIDNVLIFKNTAVILAQGRGDLTAEMTAFAAGKK